MPMYDYECQDGHLFEYWQSIKDDPLDECPVHDIAGHVLFHSIAPSDLWSERCKSSVKRLISNTSFVLKGKGWYKDGYTSS